ncbi:hypothetical protein PGT21_012282 [Puccinia graminis f. sp. tritici]|uniref:Uncharacterized protein n=1 Tax=Puccinia graminis f. sp. tritici TaxID=56615 RepID=A0A5B0NMY2_PUCGR|nr:hypothetical protein PGT21_012282 [Puccinia graminis f. sp. tritici]
MARQAERNLPAFFTSRERRQDGKTVYQCTLCPGSEVLSYRRHALGVQHRERVREHDEQMAREHRQQIEEENKPPIQIEAVESDNGDEEEENTTHNIDEILHAMGLTANGPGSTESSRRNLHENIGLDDLINAHLEDLFRHDDETVFESDEPADPEDAIDDPDEQSRWFPFKNKMDTPTHESRAKYTTNSVP